jgi:hypothetical protein
MTINVKVIRLPGDVKNVPLNSGATVADAARAAGFSLNGNETIQINSSEATANSYVSDGDSVVISVGAKGNGTVVETQTLVNGKNVASMSRHQLLDAAVEVKRRIKELKEANEGFESVAVDKEIGQLTVDLGKIKDLLDSKKD